MKLRNNLIYASCLLVGFVFMSCGGGSNNVSSLPTSTSQAPAAPPVKEPTDWVKSEFLAATEFKDKCAIPRTVPDSNGDIFADVQGSSQHEKMWLRSWTNETYLWYQEVEDVDPSLFSVLDYFVQLKTDVRTPSGKLKDQFHSAVSTEEQNKLIISGAVEGFGINWAVVNNLPPRSLIVKYVEPNSPAALAGIDRGFELKIINDIDVVNTNSQSDLDIFVAALDTPSNQIDTNFSFTDLNGETVNASILATDVILQPVQNTKVIDTASAKVGYMQFNTFINSAQDGLITGFQQFVDENVTELVLDLRYNLGGALDIASQVAFMIAGDAQTDQQTFINNELNDKLQPFLIPFHNTAIDWQNFEFIEDQTLPSLELTRVFILSTQDTCSASETIINGLRGIDVEVVLIGGETCGKPYSFVGAENCGSTYFTVQAHSKNAKGFGEYTDGFKPSENPILGHEIQGCEVQDDLTLALGSANEALLASALNYMQTGECLPQIANKPAFEQKASGIAIPKSNPVLASILLEHRLRKQTNKIRYPSAK